MTPATLTGLLEGSYKLTLKKDDLKAEEMIEIRPDVIQTVSLQLEKERFIIRIYSTPQKAEVYLRQVGRNKYLGVTPIEYSVIDTSDRYTFLLHKPGYSWEVVSASFQGSRIRRIRSTLGSMKRLAHPSQQHGFDVQVPIEVYNPSDLTAEVILTHQFLPIVEKYAVRKKYREILYVVPGEYEIYWAYYHIPAKESFISAVIRQITPTKAKLVTERRYVYNIQSDRYVIELPVLRRTQIKNTGSIPLGLVVSDMNDSAKWKGTLDKMEHRQIYLEPGEYTVSAAQIEGVPVLHEGFDLLCEYYRPFHLERCDISNIDVGLSFVVGTNETTVPVSAVSMLIHTFGKLSFIADESVNEVNISRIPSQDFILNGQGPGIHSPLRAGIPVPPGKYLIEWGQSKSKQWVVEIEAGATTQVTSED